jgi:hypothetical protein
VIGGTTTIIVGCEVLGGCEPPPVSPDVAPVTSARGR